MAVSSELEGLRAPDWRISDADRERVAERLRAGLTEGRLTPDEFTERMATAMSAIRYADAEPVLADLPGGPLSAPPRAHAELRSSFGNLKRRGGWVVPRRLTVSAVVGSVKLDFTGTVVAYPVVEIDIGVYFGSTVLVLPADASADIDGVELVASPAKMRRVSASPGLGTHFVVRGRQVAGRLVVRHQRRFWRWRW
jgi:Domain of unknown function (DUF1707)